MLQKVGNFPAFCHMATKSVEKTTTWTQTIVLRNILIIIRIRYKIT